MIIFKTVLDEVLLLISNQDSTEQGEGVMLQQAGESAVYLFTRVNGLSCVGYGLLFSIPVVHSIVI